MCARTHMPRTHTNMVVSEAEQIDLNVRAKIRLSQDENVP